MVEEIKIALKQMLADGELDRIIKCTKGNEKREVKKFKDLLENSEDIEKIPFIPLVMSIKSPLLFQDLLIHMADR